MIFKQRFLSQILALAATLMITVVHASKRGPGGDVKIELPDEPMYFWFNFVMRMVVLACYGFFLVWTAYNIVHYIILKQRYKEFAIILYYTFFVALFVTRVVQTLFQIFILNDEQIKNCIIAADGFSVAIGLTQVALIGDLIISLQCFEQQA